MAKTVTTRFVGKHTEYDLIDGVYYIAPMYVDGFMRLVDRRNGVDQLVKSVARHVAEINKEIMNEQRVLWERIVDDLGLDNKKHYQYQNGTIYEVEDLKEG